MILLQKHKVLPAAAGLPASKGQIR